MNCRRIEEMIPLFVEGDLELDETAVVSSHLRTCEVCSRLANEYTESQNWLRTYEPPVFDSAVLDELKSGVLARIDRDERRPSFFQLVALRWRLNAALAGAALLAILIGLVVYGHRRQQTADAKYAEQHDAAPELKPRPAPEEKIEPQIQVLPRRKQSVLRDAVAVIDPSRLEWTIGPPAEWVIDSPPDFLIENAALDDRGEPPPLEVTAADQTNTLTGDSVTRIEIQTSDPNVRIIWFAPNNVDKSSTKPSTEF